MTIIETPRLSLRNMMPEDAGAFSLFNENPEFYRYLEHAITKELTQNFVDKGMDYNARNPRRHWYMALVEKTSGKAIGDIVLHANPKNPLHVAGIGFGMDPDYWGKGLMTEALQAMTEYAHETLGFHRIDTSADGRNTGSCRVLEKCGYVCEGYAHYSVKVLNGWAEKTAQYASVKPGLLPK